MNSRIYTYALVKSLYDEHDDYIDAFRPFLIKSIPKDKSPVAIDQIKDRIKQDFQLDIPIHTLKTILKRARKSEYIEQPGHGKQYIISDKGLQYLDAFEVEQTVERRLNSLFGDISSFLDDHKIPTSNEQINETLLSFVNANLVYLIAFFNPSGASRVLHYGKSKITYFEKCLFQYIDIAEKQRPEQYIVLQEILYGSVISTILCAPDVRDINEIKTRRFKRCDIYLDSNVTFFILGLHTKEFNEPAQELYELLRKNELNLKIFDFTVAEMCRVLNGYSTSGHRYSTRIRVDTLYSSLRIKRWSRTDAREFILNIESHLTRLGIQIEQTRIDLLSYVPRQSRLRRHLKAYKPQQDEYHLTHDIAAIERVRALRKRSIRSIEDSQYIFLTSDKILSKFNFFEMGHQRNATICEAILDSLLTNILWLKDPSANITLKSLIAAFSRGLFIKRRVWDRFYETLRDLRQKDIVEDKDISTLFYHDYIEDILLELDETEVDKITENFVLEHIEKASEQMEEETTQKMEQQEIEFITRLKEGVSAVEKDTNEAWLAKIAKLKENIRTSARRSSRLFSYMCASTLLLTMVITLLMLYSWLKAMNASDLLTWALPLTIGAGGIYGIWEKTRIFFFRIFYNSEMKARLRDMKGVGLDELIGS